ncbi:MAG: nitroreductase/quinone reductase family protein, partial [Chloroflexota bacterium]
LPLARTPRAARRQEGRERLAVTPELRAGDDRAGAWERVVAAAPGFARYPEQTDRAIPLVRLTRTAG